MNLTIGPTIMIILSHRGNEQSAVVSGAVASICAGVPLDFLDRKVHVQAEINGFIIWGVLYGRVKSLSVSLRLFHVVISHAINPLNSAYVCTFPSEKLRGDAYESSSYGYGPFLTFIGGLSILWRPLSFEILQGPQRDTTH
jgi:hypothetical protein